MVAQTVLFFATRNIRELGGAGYVERMFIKALRELGYDVVVLVSNSSFPSIMFSRVRKHRRIKSVKDILNQKEAEIAIFMGSLSKSILKHLRGNRDIKIIAYYHMLTPWYYEIKGYYKKYSWRDLSMLYLAWTETLSKVLTYDFNPFAITDYVVVNSEYMSLLASRYWGEKPHVLSPPIVVNVYRRFVKDFKEREYILCFGRISPEKRYEEVIKALALTVSKPKLLIAGALKNRKEVMYLRSLLNLAKTLGVRLMIKLNVDEKTKIELFSKALTYVHPTIGEHFGITVIEAMATGTPVIVHKSGEPYFGITQRGNAGLVFTEPTELAEDIDMLLMDPELWLEYHTKALNRSMYYDYSSFMKNLKGILCS